MLVNKKEMTMTKQKRKRHGACKFNPDLGEKICAALADGQSILAIARIEEMPPESTIRRWGRNSKWSSEEFVAEFARAREDNADHHFDRMQEIEARLEKEDIDPHSARVLLDSMKWRLAKQLPRSYSDRTKLDMTADLQVTTQVDDDMPEWMRKQLEEQSRSISKERETTGNGQTEPIH